MKEIEAIKQALAAGPTPGLWNFELDPTEADARLIATCNPAAMQAIIDHIDALEKAAADFQMDYRMKCDAETKALHAEIERLRVALKFYAEGDHFNFDRDAWDTVSDEPQNFWCDEAGTATVEDGTIAKLALCTAPQPAHTEVEVDPAQRGEPVKLKAGECWPEDIMREWDYWRAAIALGCTSSQPRDWFESLAEMVASWTATAPDDRVKELEAELAATETVITEYRQQCLDNATEIARLRSESEERLQNCAALVAEVERLRKDAERYQWLAEYLVSDDESYDDAIVAATTVAELDYVTDAAMKGTP